MRSIKIALRVYKKKAEIHITSFFVKLRIDKVPLYNTQASQESYKIYHQIKGKIISLLVYSN